MMDRDAGSEATGRPLGPQSIDTLKIQNNHNNKLLSKKDVVKTVYIRSEDREISLHELLIRQVRKYFTIKAAYTWKK